MAFKDITYKNWNYNSQNSSKAELITKLTDLDSPLYDKHLLGFYMNYIQSEGNTTSLATSVRTNSINILLRANTSDEFTHVGTISSGSDGNATGSFHKELRFSGSNLDISHPNYKEYNVNQVQIKLDAKFLSSGFSINDFGLIYRVKREISTKDHDED